MVGYLHNLSPIKTSQNKNQYFSLNFQTNSQVYRAVCFSPEKHSVLKRKFESSSPVKINKFQLKKNQKTDKEELILNKRTRIEDPHESEMDFDLQQVDAETVEAVDSSVEEIQERDNNSLVNIAGRISFNGSAETVNVRGKTLTKQETLFTDNSGSLRLVLWVQDTTKMESGQCYNISNVAIKEFNGANYLTLTKYSIVKRTDNLKIDRQDDVLDNTQEMKVQFPPDGINYVQSYVSCNKCHSKVVQSDKKIIKCSECGLMQLKSKCRSKIMASILTITGKESLSLNIFDDTIKQLYTIKKDQDTDFQKDFEELDDDDITELILTVEATVVFNDKNAKEVIQSV